MLTGFDKYNEEQQSFRKSKLYPVTYKAVVHFLYEHVNREPVVSGRLERLFNVAGSEIREIVRFARRKGHPIVSGGRGYSIEPDYEKLLDGIQHLRERAISQLVTIRKMKQLCPRKAQMSFRLTFPKKAA